MSRMSFTAPDAVMTPEIDGAEVGSGTSKISIAPGPSATVLYMAITFPPAASTSFLTASNQLVLGLSIRAFNACGV